MVTSDFRPEVEIRPFHACTMKKCNITLIYARIAKIFTSQKKSASRNTTVTSDFRPKVEIWPFCAFTMHPAIIIETARSLWTWQWGRYHVPQNVFLVISNSTLNGTICCIYCYLLLYWLEMGQLTIINHAISYITEFNDWSNYKQQSSLSP